MKVFIPLKSEQLNRDAIAFNQAAIEYAIKNQVDLVVLSGLWSSSVTTSRFELCFTSTVDRLVKAGIRVAIVRDVAVYKAPVPLLLATAIQRGEDPKEIGVPPKTYSLVNDKVNTFFDRV